MNILLKQDETILILAAMKVEAEVLFNHIENKKQCVIDGYEFYIGDIHGIHVVLGITGIMSLNATLATYIGIKHFKPAFVILEGSAGGYTKELHDHDIVIGTSSIDITRLITPIKDRNEGSNSLEWKLVEFDEHIDGFCTDMKYEYGATKLIDHISKIPYLHGKVIKGIVGSGNVWNNEVDRIEWFYQKYGIVCEEMETYVVYTVCNQHHIPAISVRVISNNIVNKEEFSYEAIHYLQEYILDWIKLL